METSNREDTMTKSAANKAVKPAPARRMAKQASAPGMPVSISEIAASGADLGNGYVLIKLHDRPRSKSTAKDTPSVATSLKLPGVPLVPADEVRKLFHRFEDLVRAKPTAAKRTAVRSLAAPMPRLLAANQDLLKQFESGEFERREDLKAAGQLVGSGELAERLGVSRQAITKAVQDLRMFSLDGSGGKKLYPAFFASSQLDRGVLESVSKKLGKLAGPSKWQFFTSPRFSLDGRTPIEALESGHLDAVMAAAGAFVEA